ncbi:MAG TPA: Asp-tRNA(Asn)/Glu-tRNA(Gln) amidotransferase subunit GatC [Patescibacteria group bacterium]
MISRDEVKHIAGLARIGLGEKDVDKFSKDLSAVLDWVKELQEVDVTNVPPMAHITGTENVTREDKTRDFLDKDKIVELFPEKKDGYGKVKSIL